VHGVPLLLDGLTTYAPFKSAKLAPVDMGRPPRTSIPKPSAGLATASHAAPLVLSAVRLFSAARHGDELGLTTGGDQHRIASPPDHARRPGRLRHPALPGHGWPSVAPEATVTRSPDREVVEGDMGGRDR
jgi:hypothetical protein